MDDVNLFQALDNITEYQKMQPKDRVQLRKRRLYELVTYSREHSPLYASIYENLKENFTLSDLPTIDKATILSNYDRWSTDSNVKLDDIYKHMKSDPSGSHLYLNKYYLVSSSGTEGTPLICLYDKSSGRIMSAEFIKRSFARREHLWGFLSHRSRLASIYTENGAFFYNTFSNMRKNIIPFRKKRSILLQSQSSSSSLANSLNSFKPSMVAGFPSVLLRMADEKKAGRLKISPVCMIADGEPLENADRKRLEKVFNCDITTSYSSAITGCIAYECREHHLHINDDRIILEPVDMEGNPVSPGTPSDKVLVTNLTSFTQPVIRYELGDRLIIHDKPCLCGNSSPWVEVVGRSLDTLRLIDGSREILIPVAELDAVLKNEDYIKRYQIIIYPNTHIALRLVGAGNTDKTIAFFKAEKLLRAYLKDVGIVAPMITLEKEDPRPHPLSGKYQTIIIE